jgi:hypothetical protein
MKDNFICLSLISNTTLYVPARNKREARKIVCRFLDDCNKEKIDITKLFKWDDKKQFRIEFLNKKIGGKCNEKQFKIL